MEHLDADFHYREANVARKAAAASGDPEVSRIHAEIADRHLTLASRANLPPPLQRTR